MSNIGALLRLSIIIVGSFFVTCLAVVAVLGGARWGSGWLIVPALPLGADLALFCVLYMEKTKTGLFGGSAGGDDGPDTEAAAAVDVENVRLAVYRGFAQEGRPPAVEELARRLEVPPGAVQDALKQLAAARHLALDEAGRVVMAHPFSAVPLGFSVMGANTLWWGGCAWDSFAMAQLLPGEPSLLVATTCPACSTPHAWNVTRSAPPIGDQVAHFLVPAARMWDDVVHTCGHQRLFCNETCVQVWLDQTGNPRGYVMDLTTLWRLASDWYTGRLDRGYTRREPSAAADYLRGVGLSGPFWGL